MCECSHYDCGSTIITFHLKLTRKSQPITPNAIVSKRNVSSLGLLHSADSIVHVTANWFYSVLQFAKTDKDGFPRLFPFRSPLSLRHKQLIDRFDDVANWYLGEMWGKQTSCSSDSFFLSPCRHLQSLAEVIYILSSTLLRECFSSEGNTSLLLLPARHRFLDKPKFWLQGEEPDTIELCLLGEESSAKVCKRWPTKSVVCSASVPHERFTCQCTDLQMETMGVKNEGGFSSWRTSNSKCKQHVRVHHQNACKKTMRPSPFFTTLPEMCRNAEAWTCGRGSGATVIVRAALWSGHLLDNLLLNINPPFAAYFNDAEY